MKNESNSWSGGISPSCLVDLKSLRPGYTISNSRYGKSLIDSVEIIADNVVVVSAGKNSIRCSLNQNLAEFMPGSMAFARIEAGYVNLSKYLVLCGSDNYMFSPIPKISGIIKNITVNEKLALSEDQSNFIINHPDMCLNDLYDKGFIELCN